MDELKIPGAITVAELIAQLQELDPQASVVIAHPSGDYWKTILAAAVRPHGVAKGLVCWSAYHESWIVPLNTVDQPRRAVIIWGTQAGEPQ